MPDVAAVDVQTSDLATLPPPANDAAPGATPAAASVPNADVPNADVPDADAADWKIADFRFMQRLKRLQDLQDFLLAETVKIDAADAYLTGNLNLLHASENGRMPSMQEWHDLEASTQKLFGYINGDLRRKFLLGQAPKLIVILPGAFLALALASLIAALYFRFPSFFCYLAWMISLGAIGAVSFISVNTLSIQTTATFDINNRRLILVRVVLGSLFAVVLSIGFGYPTFLSFLNQISTLGNPSTPIDALTQVGGDLVKNTVLLLLPFLLGFSTTLVIGVLNRLVESAGIFFGGQAPVANPGGKA
jgi:hypothetical protein